MAARYDYVEYQANSGIGLLIDDLTAFVEQKAPELLGLFHIFAQEAKFGRHWLALNLDILKDGATILEVGGGLMILSCQLMREGYAVTSIEPIGIGFSSFADLQKIILEYAADNGIKPRIITTPVEQLTIEEEFDFAFSINVMEHIEDVAQGLAMVYKAVKPNAAYRFTCPNYLFPYEPHFNIPTFFSKRLTERLLRKSLFNNDTVNDPIALWNSLNWINVYQIKKICAGLPDAELNFDSKLLGESFERIVKDHEFAKRRPIWLKKLIRLIIFLRIHRVTAYLPLLVLPIIDCSITKKRLNRDFIEKLKLKRICK